MQTESLHYLEFSSQDIKASIQFFTQVFKWEFTLYGEAYAAFKQPQNHGLEGGFFQNSSTNTPTTNTVLPLFYNKDLKAIQEKITQHNGIITKEVFEFPGGKRFHFKAPGDIEMAVWSE